MLRLIVNIHPVAYDLVFEEISLSDAERLLTMIEESIAGSKKSEEKKLLNRHNLYLSHGKQLITIEDDFDCSEEGRCTMTFDQFKSLLLEKINQPSGDTFSN